MAIILEFKDYNDVSAAYEMIQEGFLGELWNKMKDYFGGVGKEVDATIANGEIDKMLDLKTGDLAPEAKKVIDSISAVIGTAEEPETPESGEVKAAMEKAFSDFEKMAGGMYYTQSLKLMKDGMIALMDDASAAKTGTGAAAVTTAQENTPESKMAGEGISEQMKKRMADFNKTYTAAKSNLQKTVKDKMAALIKKATAEDNKLLVNSRFSTTETVLLLIEYDIKKLRISIANLTDLKNTMVTAYKTALTSTKELQDRCSNGPSRGRLLRIRLPDWK